MDATANSSGRRKRSFVETSGTRVKATKSRACHTVELDTARTNGLTNDEIKELILQTAVYCGVPDANTAFRIAQGVLDELDGEGDS